MQQSYDGDGQGSKKVDNGVTTYYLRSSVLGGQVACELTSYGGFQRGYVYAGSQVLAVQQNNAVSWVAQDPVTKSQRITALNGTVTSVIDLDPWGGETTKSSNQAFQPHRFTSYERDSDNNDEAMFRRYTGAWMRMTQPDPYAGSYDMADPQSFNRYSYVQNDPVNFVDPSGLDSLSDGIASARDALRSGICRALFGPDDDPNKLLDFYANPRNGMLKIGDITPSGKLFERGDVARTSSQTGKIVINAHGLFETGMAAGIAGDIPVTMLPRGEAGVGGLSLREIRGLTIIHELLHAVSRIPGDATSEKQSQLNSDLVRLFCFVLPNAPLSTTTTVSDRLIGGGGDGVGSVGRTFPIGFGWYISPEIIAVEKHYSVTVTITSVIVTELDE